MIAPSRKLGVEGVKIGGYIGLCSWFPQSLTPEGERALRGVPALLLHGTQDTVVPFWLGQKALERCIDCGMDAHLLVQEGVSSALSPSIARTCAISDWPNRATRGCTFF
jgi:hypothetical protein